ncbi:MAG: HypC/HybG/HupF family hydrogenase formation chaperone [Sedimentisphaeraceae bacterium JB056]
MCLAVPGKIITVEDHDKNELLRTAKVDFNGTTANISLMLTPEAQAGDYVLVHAGQSLEVIGAEDAAEIWKYLE